MDSFIDEADIRTELLIKLEEKTSMGREGWDGNAGFIEVSLCILGQKPFFTLPITAAILVGRDNHRSARW